MPNTQNTAIEKIGIEIHEIYLKCRKSPNKVPFLNREEGKEIHKLLHQNQTSAREELLEEIKKNMISGELRESFEENFPKDEEARLGIRPSKSNRMGALALWGDITIFLQSLTNHK